MRKLADHTFWTAYWEHQPITDFVLAPLLDKFVPTASEYCEIGCSPGSTLIHFFHTRQCKVTGLDYAAIAATRTRLDSAGVDKYTLIEEDFLTFHTDVRYDVVASYGFIEHFDDPQVIIEKQAGLVKEDGLLIISVPNIRYFNYVLYKLFAPKLLSIHNLSIMDVKVLRDTIKALDFDILYGNYYKSCFLFFNPNNAAIATRPLLKMVFHMLRRCLTALNLDRLPNRFFSPYIVLVARKAIS